MQMARLKFNASSKLFHPHDLHEQTQRWCDTGGGWVGFLFLLHVDFIIQVFISLLRPPPRVNSTFILRSAIPGNILGHPSHRRWSGANTRLQRRCVPSATERQLPTHPSWGALAQPPPCNNHSSAGHMPACLPALSSLWRG